VRIGNQAHEHLQHDVYGQIVLSTVQAVLRRAACCGRHADDFAALEPIGERRFELHDKPDASLWEFRGREAVHTYSSVMCWAACDRLGNAAAKLSLAERAEFWNGRAAPSAPPSRPAPGTPTRRASPPPSAGDELDASLLQLVDVRFVPPDDPRMQATMAAVEHGLRRGPYMLRYAIPTTSACPRPPSTSAPSG
jgi:GH15 family glucan-1,4-alpha-glucosidase